MGGPAQTSGFGGLGGSGYSASSPSYQVLFSAQYTGIASGFLRGIPSFYSAGVTAAAAASSEQAWPANGGRMRRLTLQTNIAYAAAITYTVYVDGAPTALTGVFPAGSTAIVEVDINVDIPAAASPHAITVAFTSTVAPVAGQYGMAIVSGDLN